MDERKSKTDSGKGGGRPTQGGRSADPTYSLGRSFPSFAGMLLAAKEILVGGFSDSWCSGIFDILRDLTESSSFDLIGSVFLGYSYVFW